MTKRLHQKGKRLKQCLHVLAFQSCLTATHVNSADVLPDPHLSVFQFSPPFPSFPSEVIVSSERLAWPATLTLLGAAAAADALTPLSVAAALRALREGARFTRASLGPKLLEQLQDRAEVLNREWAEIAEIRVFVMSSC